MPAYVRVDVVFALWIVELLRARPNDHVIVHQLTEIDARLGDLQIDGRDRRQIADEQDRQSFTRHLVDRAERQAVAVREDEPFVDPGAIGQRRRIELAYREHHLPVLAVDLVAIVIDRHEVVIGANLLDLPKRLEQRLVIPQPHVLERPAVVLDVLLAEGGLAAQLALLDQVEGKRVARRGDVVFHEGRLAHLLVGGHDETLQHARVAFAAEQDDGVERGPGDDVAIRSAERGRDRQTCGNDRREHQGQRRRHARMRVGVAGALDDSRRLDDLLQAAEPGAEREHEEEHRREPSQVAARAIVDPQSEGRHGDLAGREIQPGDSCRGEQDEAERHASQQCQRRQGKDIHRRVVAKHRVRLAKGHLVPPREERHPLA